jgi:uncharacterized protein YsxB (DUF464 family)
MIQVAIIRKRQSYQMMKVTGHANSAPYGEDLVCAAVSAVITGGINALDLQAVKVKNTEGLSDLQILDPKHESNQSVYRVMHIQLQTIANDYPKFIRINLKEE